MQVQDIDIALIQPNEGQLEGLQANPRQITEEQFEKLKNNITAYPELLEYRGLMVYPNNGKYITIGGNMRLKALQDLGIEKAPCIVLPEDTTTEQLQAYIILDNDNFGRWDWDKLADEWDVDFLDGMGIDNPLLIGKEWDELPYIEDEQKEPTLDKDIKITVVIPFEEKDIRAKVELAVKEALKPYPNVTLQ